MVPTAASPNSPTPHTDLLWSGVARSQPITRARVAKLSKKQFHGERNKVFKGWQKNYHLTIFAMNWSFFFFFLLFWRLISRKEKTSDRLVKGSVFLYKMQLAAHQELARGYSFPWARQLNHGRCCVEDDSSTSLEKPKQKIPLFNHSLSYTSVTPASSCD